MARAQTYLVAGMCFYYIPDDRPDHPETLGTIDESALEQDDNQISKRDSCSGERELVDETTTEKSQRFNLTLADFSINGWKRAMGAASLLSYNEAASSTTLTASHKVLTGAGLPGSNADAAIGKIGDGVAEQGLGTGVVLYDHVALANQYINPVGGVYPRNHAAIPLLAYDATVLAVPQVVTDTLTVDPVAGTVTFGTPANAPAQGAVFAICDGPNFGTYTAEISTGGVVTIASTGVLKAAETAVSHKVVDTDGATAGSVFVPGTHFELPGHGVGMLKIIHQDLVTAINGGANAVHVIYYNPGLSGIRRIRPGTIEGELAGTFEAHMAANKGGDRWVYRFKGKLRPTGINFAQEDYSSWTGVLSILADSGSAAPLGELLKIKGETEAVPAY